MSDEAQEATTVIAPNDIVHVKDAFMKFLLDLEAVTTNDRGEQSAEKIYYEQIAKISRQLIPDRHLIVDWDHCIAASEEGMQPLFTLIQSHFAVIHSHLTAVVREIAENILREDAAIDNDLSQRHNKVQIHLGFRNMPPLKEGIRAFSAHLVSRLVSFEATVTRSSGTRPCIEMASFQCPECLVEIQKVPQEYKFEAPKVCPGIWNPDTNSYRKCDNKRFRLLNDQCTFVDWQKLRVQEDATKVPEGSMPRSMDVIVTGDMTEVAHPGDRVRFTGCLLSIPDVGALYKASELPKSISRERNRKAIRNEGSNEGVAGLAALGVRTLTHKLIFMATHVDKSSVKTQSIANSGLVAITNGVAEPFYGNASAFEDAEAATGRVVMSEVDWDRMSSLAGSADLPDRMSQLIAPNIFGYEMVKKGILLMLVGGIPKNTKGDQIQLRGDINVCIVGDPATAKSQLLKYVNSLLHRCVYASGKTSTAAGLTASVNRDRETGDFIIEAGALMLADNGVCCIDGFDKMDPKDMVAIHEAMEQQTISIAKAGIQASLNARASILAACNPLLGRYDRSRPLNKNVGLTPPIMSRFDLFFVLVDEQRPEADEQMAQHIINVHMDAKPTRFKPMDEMDRSPDDDDARRYLRNYIKYARTFTPFMGPAVRQSLVNYYVALRRNDTSSNRLAYRITVRQLESLVRLSEAMAKSRLSNEISHEDVTAAFNLLKDSIVHVQRDSVDLDGMDNLQASEIGQSSTDGHGKKTDEAPGTAPVMPDVNKQAKFKVSFEMYQKISLHMGVYLDRMSSMGIDVTLHELVSWYVSEYYDGDQNDEQAIQQYEQMITKIILRLIRKDNVLIFVDEVENDLSLSIVGKHPNFVVSAGFEPIPNFQAQEESTSPPVFEPRDDDME